MGEGERGRHPAKCSFCGKRQEQVRKLVAGPGVFICDHCIRLCNEIVDEDASSGCAGTGTPTRSPGSESVWRRFLAGRWRNWRLVL